MVKFISCLAAILGHLTLGFEARAQTVGDPQDGLALAQQICSPCHATVPQQDRSPNPKAPRLAELSATPGMTSTALLVALTTPHSGMPMFTLTPGQRDDIIAYILSLH
jgi:mono/diheme cytochrome c family protein